MLRFDGDQLATVLALVSLSFKLTRTHLVQREPAR